ncbi:MAG: pilus assembly protein [Deltaproteobacteria bacterium]|nr:MAG: pilus assembly protein [Deltaproteobacteria bacterium]
MRILRRLKNDEQGQSMLEFIISFPIVLFLVLAIMQLALMWNAKHVVNYAAFCAARSYIVYGDESKAAQAARIATIPISAKASGILSSVSGINLAGFLPSGIISSVAYAADKSVYSFLATSITLLDGSGNALSDTGGSPGVGEDITVEVTHKFRLIFPVVNKLIGRNFRETFGPGNLTPSWFQSLDNMGWLPVDIPDIESNIDNFFGDLYFFPITARCTLTMEETGDSSSSSSSPSCPYCFRTGPNAGMCFTADQVEQVPGGWGYRLKSGVASSLGYTGRPFVSSNCQGL